MTCITNWILFVVFCSLFVSSYVDAQTSYESTGNTISNRKMRNDSLEYRDINMTKELFDSLMTKRCIAIYAERTRRIEDLGVVYCNSTFDSVTCWPTTPAGQYASVPCPSTYYGDKLDSSKNTTRYCNLNGLWNKTANYMSCIFFSERLDATSYIYFSGYSLSILALSVALFVFLRFRSLRCLRNTIHSHLMLTFLLAAISWIAMSTAFIKKLPLTHPWLCKSLVTAYNYMAVCNYFWMFIEGLYLTTMILFAYSTDKIKFWHYALIGYGIPLPIIISWVSVRIHFRLADDSIENKGKPHPSEQCWLPKASGHNYDFIYIGPILLALFLNVLFFVTILWVLITKLRATNNLETRRYRKAARATLVLIPLLGITYVLFILPPSKDQSVKFVFKCIVAVLQSTQGLWIAIFYCFLNGEVRQAVRRRISEWHDTRSLTTRFTRAGSSAGSPVRNSTIRKSIQNIPLANGGNVASAPLQMGEKRDKNYNESDNDSLDGNGSSSASKKKASDTPLMDENYV